MLGFTHSYYSTILAVRRLESLDDVASLLGAARDELQATPAYVQGSYSQRADLMKSLVKRYTAFRIGYRVQKYTSWLDQAIEAGDVFTLHGGGYPSHYFVRGKHILPQLQFEVMKDVSDLVHPAELPAPDDWVYVEEWDQS